MKRKCFTVNPFEMNCYLYWDETSADGVIIDPGVYYDDEKQKLIGFTESHGISVKLILNTHGHIDHIMGNKWAKEYFKAPILIHRGDLPLIRGAIEQGEMFGLKFPAPPQPDRYIEESDVIEAGTTQLKVVHTPGHSPGSVCFVDEDNKIIFGGDTVFRGSIGRTDLWMGDLKTLLDSVNNKIMTYGDDYIICPGHMEETTVGEEKISNPFLV